MIRRNAIPVICVVLAGFLAACCGFIVFNFMRLAEAEGFADAFVRQAVAEGPAMDLPTIAPAAREALSRESMTVALKRARQIGPLTSVEASSCVLQGAADNLCGGQLFACIVQGTGRGGGFQADVAMCRGGNFEPYRLAGARWTFRFTNGEPIASDDRSPI